MKKNVVILVATHKPDKVYQDDIYTPIHVGRAVSKFKEGIYNQLLLSILQVISQKYGRNL